MSSPKVTNPEPSTVEAPAIIVEDTTVEQINVGGAPMPLSLKLNMSQVGQSDFLSEPFSVQFTIEHNTVNPCPVLVFTTSLRPPTAMAIKTVSQGVPLMLLVTLRLVTLTGLIGTTISSIKISTTLSLDSS